jgi:hypothetical protein
LRGSERMPEFQHSTSEASEIWVFNEHGDVLGTSLRGADMCAVCYLSTRHRNRYTRMLLLNFLIKKLGSIEMTELLD